MSEQAVLWLFGVLLATLGALVLALARIFWTKLAKIDSGDLAAFEAKDTQREKDWLSWREIVNTRLGRHADKLEQMATHELRIARLEKLANGKLGH